MSTDINIETEEEEVICANAKSPSSTDKINCNKSNISRINMHSVHDSIEEACSFSSKSSDGMKDRILTKKPVTSNKKNECIVSRPRYDFSRRGISKK